MLGRGIAGAVYCLGSGAGSSGNREFELGGKYRSDADDGEIGGGALPDDRIIDGIDIADVWHGTRHDLRRPYFYYQHDCLRAVRFEKWKLMLPQKEPVNGSVAWRWSRHISKADAQRITEPELYDLEADIGETTNVAKENPEIVGNLLEIAERARNDIGDHDRFGKGARHFGAPTRRLSRAPRPSKNK